VRIACLFPTPVLLALLQRTMPPSVSDGAYSGQIARQRALSGNAA
jgi:hypothetical protein